MRKVSSKNVLMKDGSVRRRPYDECEHMLSTNQAKRYISNTVYRALKMGIEVKDLNTRDEDGKLRSQIKAIRSKSGKKKGDSEESEPSET